MGFLPDVKPIDGGGQTVNIAGAAARSTQLAVGTKYAITAEADCYIVAGSSSVDATTADHFLREGEPPFYYVPRTVTADDYISCIQKSTSVTSGLHICAVSD